MLSEAVIEELSRKSPFTEHLVRLAWPSLTTESKLQVITAHQSDFSPSTPNWLVDLALDDVPVVQYFALRHSYLRSKPEDGSENMFRPVTDEEDARHRRAHDLENEVVRTALDSGSSLFMKEPLCHMPQLSRLAFFRQCHDMGLDTFMEWLELALKKGVPDDDLAECAHEYMQNPQTKERLATAKFDFPSGEAAYFAGRGMELGWELLRTAGPMLQMQLFWVLPTEYGMSTMKPEVLASMPERILDFILTHPSPTKEMRAVQDLVMKNPERYPPKVVEDFRRHQENDFETPQWSEEERTDFGRPNRPDPARQTLEVALQLKKRLESISEELAAVKEAASAKRGFFG